MGNLALQSLAVVAATLFVWRILRRIMARDPLAIIPGPKSNSWFLGNLKELLAPESLPVFDELALKHGTFYRINGLFNSSFMFVSDPKALHHILVKDTHLFEESSDFLRTNAKVFGSSLLAASGEQHRKQRKMLSPVFSTAHMREMTPTFFHVVRKMRDSITQQVKRGDAEIDLLGWMGRAALELVGQSGYGYSFDTLAPDAEEHPVAQAIKSYMGTINDPALGMVKLAIFPYIHNLGSPRFQRAVVDMLPWPKLHQLRDQVDVMHRTAVKIFEGAKRSMMSGEDTSTRVGGGKDIMSVLLKANMKANDVDKLSDEDLIAQISTLTFAAMDTTSNALSRTLHILSENLEAQRQLRQEICDALENSGNGCDELDYDVLAALPYLDAVCRETLRLEPPGPLAIKECIADAILPLSKPIVCADGKERQEIFIPKGTPFFTGIRSCNRDPEIWGPDAAEWKPERWLTPLPGSVSEARVPGIYSNLMTFLGGHRSCIGFKFAQLEMKVVLALLLQRFEFTPGDKNVIWLNNGIVQPSTDDAPVDADGKKELRLPLKVRFAHVGLN